MARITGNGILPETSGANRAVLGIGCGGSGTTIITTYKRISIDRDGGLGPGVRLLGFDVLPDPIEVNVGGKNVRLTPGVEYLQIGRGCQPPALRTALRRDAVDEELHNLIRRQPAGRLARSLQNGSEGERIFGAIGLWWSRAEVRQMIGKALTELSDIRLLASRKGAATSLLVIVAAGTAGGVGASIALPIVGDVKREAHRLGVEPTSYTIVGVNVLPEVFETSVLRYSNGYDTIKDIDFSQAEGSLPW